MRCEGAGVLVGGGAFGPTWPSWGEEAGGVTGGKAKRLFLIRGPCAGEKPRMASFSTEWKIIF